MDRLIFDEEHEMFRDSMRSFFKNEIAPHSDRWHEEGCVDREAYLKAGEMGMLCMWADEEYGGIGVKDFRYEQILMEENAKYGDQVRIVFRQFPLDNLHPNARKAAEASLCAKDQGKFWEMHDSMFENQRQLKVADLKRQAGEIGLESGAFDECLDSGRYADQVQADLEAGTGAGVTGTPAFLINGRFLSGAQPLEAFEKVIDDELARAGG